MMHRLSLIAALSAAVLTGCQSVPTADEIDRMQAPDAHASHAKNLMKVFAFDMHDREDAGRGRAVTVTPEEAAAPGVDLLTSGGSGFFNGMLEKSVMAADPLETVHYFGFEPVPAWLDPARPHAWRVRSAALGSRMPDGSVFLTPERQRSLALATGRHTGLYAFDDNGVPYVGWEGAVERFAVSPEARATIEEQARRAAVPMTDKVMDTVKGWWPW